MRTIDGRKSKSSDPVLRLYSSNLWAFSRIRSLLSGSFVKFLLVGSTGTLVNLVALTLLLKVMGLRGWTASAIASLIANINNYALNNFWTFSDRLHRGIRLFRGYGSYLVMSTVGLGITTISYAWLNRVLGHTFFGESGRNTVSLSLLCQVIAILFGGYFNYVLNKTVTWSTQNRVESQERTAAD